DREVVAGRAPNAENDLSAMETEVPACQRSDAVPPAVRPALERAHEVPPSAATPQRVCVSPRLRGRVGPFQCDCIVTVSGDNGQCICIVKVQAPCLDEPTTTRAGAGSLRRCGGAPPLPCFPPASPPPR